jgi:hypothetical protein
VILGTSFFCAFSERQFRRAAPQHFEGGLRGRPTVRTRLGKIGILRIAADQVRPCCTRSERPEGPALLPVGHESAFRTAARRLGAHSVEKLRHAKIASKTWNAVLMVGRLANVVCRSALSRDDFLMIWHRRPTR